ncbi:hypothetical protein BDK51DRAFT_22618 [Blyttiomyces helicus]|uniref:Eukaryotic translation initiation factor 3 subunit M n=1 Tax=Blyttiomyces helicus TaxID=388810 RepID=A0A4P9W529_9FUNG|nr:hypothetical protein BDK51DRAFT_22618 [Blyttiomyces helicus]|eukprot:RKO85216.1 hypothetical protein BDK51DRAFT_22618 [Blyttiomyces helicus]
MLKTRILTSQLTFLTSPFFRRIPLCISDFESVYNLLIALVKDAAPEAVPKLVKSIAQTIAESSAERAQMKLKVLSNLYNNVDTSSPARYDVFIAIITVAAKSDELDVIVPTLPALDTWIAQWGITVAQKRALYLLLSSKLGESEAYQRESYQYALKHLITFDGADAAAVKSAKDHAVAAIKTAITLPEVLSFEDLFRIQAVQALKGTKLFDLLKIFLEESLDAYRAFVKKNAGFVEKEGLSEEDNTRKMRLLSVASLAASHVQGEVDYDTIAKVLDIEVDEVEIWIIDVIRAGLIDAKMNQLRRTMIVSRSTHRVFTEEQWQQLGEKLTAWRSNLKEVLQVLANAKLIAGTQDIAI